MSDNTFEIDVEAFAKALQSGQPINGKDGLLTPLNDQRGGGCAPPVP